MKDYDHRALDLFTSIGVTDEEVDQVFTTLQEVITHNCNDVAGEKEVDFSYAVEELEIFAQNNPMLLRVCLLKTLVITFAAINGEDLTVPSPNNNDKDILKKHTDILQ